MFTLNVVSFMGKVKVREKLSFSRTKYDILIGYYR